MHMGRIEKTDHMKKEMTQMKGDVVREIKKIDKHRGRLTYALVFFLIVFGLMLWLTWIVAATGLFTVPILSRFAYVDPLPVREVTPGISLETVVQEQLQTTLVRRLQQGNGVLTDTSLSLMLSESSFTSTFQSSIENVVKHMFETNRVQMAIEENGTFELFLPIKDRSKQTAFVATVRVILDNGKIDVKTQNVRLGSYTLPKMLVEFFSDTVIEPQVSVLKNKLGNDVRINTITYATGRLTINGDIELVR